MKVAICVPIWFILENAINISLIVCELRLCVPCSFFFNSAGWRCCYIFEKQNSDETYSNADVIWFVSNFGRQWRSAAIALTILQFAAFVRPLDVRLILKIKNRTIGATQASARRREHQPREYLADKMIFTLSSLFYNDGRLSLILVSGLRKIKSLPILWAQDRLS